MTQPSFDLTVALPVAGRTPRARHASSSGAQSAGRSRPGLALAMLQLLREAGSLGLSDYEMAAALGRGLSSMNSTRHGLRDLVVESGSYELSKFGTKRTRWTLNRDRINGARECD